MWLWPDLYLTTNSLMNTYEDGASKFLAQLKEKRSSIKFREFSHRISRERALRPRITKVRRGSLTSKSLILTSWNYLI